MAHDHRYCITFLKTPWGFLTDTGFTQDINAKDIVLLPSNSYGKWSSMLRRLQFFFEASHISEETYQKLCQHAEECETVVFYCRHGTCCNGCCYQTKDCPFWNGDRQQLSLSRLY